MIGLASPGPPRRPARTASPTARAPPPPSSPSKMPSVDEKPAGTSSRSPCHPQRKRAVRDGDHLLVRVVQRGQPDVTAGRHGRAASRAPAASAGSAPARSRSRAAGRRPPAARTACRRSRGGPPRRRPAARRVALGRANEPVAMPVSAAVARSRSRCQPSPAVRSTTTPSGTTSSPTRTSASIIADIFADAPHAVGRMRLGRFGAGLARRSRLMPGDDVGWSTMSTVVSRATCPPPPAAGKGVVSRCGPS